MNRREKVVYWGGAVLSGLFASAVIVNATFMQPRVDLAQQGVRVSPDDVRMARAHVRVRVAGPGQERAAGAAAVRHTASITRAGDYSPLIAQVQQRLARLGYDPGGIDGRLGPATRAAIRRFQKANDLPPTGEPDAGLLALLLP